MRKDKYLEQKRLSSPAPHDVVRTFESMCELSGLDPNLYLDNNGRFYYPGLTEYQDRFEGISPAVDGEIINTPWHRHDAAERGKFVLKIQSHMIDYGYDYMRGLLKPNGVYIHKDTIEEYTEQYLRKFVLYDKYKEVGWNAKKVYYDWTDETRTTVKDALVRSLAERIYRDVENHYEYVKNGEIAECLFRVWIAERADSLYPYKCDDSLRHADRPQAFYLKTEKLYDKHKLLLQQVEMDGTHIEPIGEPYLVCVYKDIPPHEFNECSPHYEYFPSIPTYHATYEPAQEIENTLTEEEIDSMEMEQLARKRETAEKRKRVWCAFAIGAVMILIGLPLSVICLDSGLGVLCCLLLGILVIPGVVLLFAPLVHYCW